MNSRCSPNWFGSHSSFKISRGKRSSRSSSSTISGVSLCSANLAKVPRICWRVDVSRPAIKPSKARLITHTSYVFPGLLISTECHHRVVPDCIRLGPIQVYQDTKRHAVRDIVSLAAGRSRTRVPGGGDPEYAAPTAPD